MTSKSVYISLPRCGRERGRYLDGIGGGNALAEPFRMYADTFMGGIIFISPRKRVNERRPPEAPGDDDERSRLFQTSVPSALPGSTPEPVPTCSRVINGGYHLHWSIHPVFHLLKSEGLCSDSYRMNYGFSSTLRFIKSRERVKPVVLYCLPYLSKLSLKIHLGILWR